MCLRVEDASVAPLMSIRSKHLRLAWCTMLCVRACVWYGAPLGRSTTRSLMLHTAFCLPWRTNTGQAAVDNEDYDTAKLIKAEMDKLRAGLSYGSDHQALDRGMGGGGGGFGGGHRPANVVLEEEELGAAGAGGAGASPYVKNPFGNKSPLGGGAPAVPGLGGMHASPSLQYPPPAHNQAYSPPAQVVCVCVCVCVCWGEGSCVCV